MNQERSKDQETTGKGEHFERERYKKGDRNRGQKKPDGEEQKMKRES